MRIDKRQHDPGIGMLDSDAEFLIDLALSASKTDSPASSLPPGNSQ